MEDWRLGDSDKGSDDSRDPNLSIDDVVSAFREALIREQSREQDSAEGDGREADNGFSRRRGREAPERDEPSGPSRRNPKVENTIAAFRKARRREEDEGADEQTRERTSGPDSGERPARDEGASERGGPTDTGPAEQQARTGGPSEGHGPDFRDALQRWTGAEQSGERREDDDSDRDSQAGAPAADDGMEQPGRAGDGVPPKRDVEVSTGGSSGASSTSPSERPPRPDASFLWVTDRPEGDSTSVSIDNLTEPRALEAEAFLLEGGGRRPYEFLTRIRGHSKANIYLKPVFWMHAVDEDSVVSDHVDGEWTRDERSALNSLQQRASSINNRIRNLASSGAREESGMELRVLRFMATRGHEFTPKRTTMNPDGFVYPQLTPLLERQSSSGGGELVQILSILEERRLLTGEFVMRQHACQNCGSGFLNFEEMCPHCGATDLDTDDLVHHFRCAFTGPLSEYKKEKGKLVCPKCDRTLKQIGVDYDKPSVVHTCRRCHEQFQDPEVQTTCYECERTNPPEQQVDRQIKEYEVTALGEETAVYGLSDSLLSILERESRVLDYATFQLIVESEAARIERYQRSASSLLLVRVAGLQQLRMELGQRSQEVVEEIATAFDNTLRSSDYLSARDESLYLFLLTETAEQGARRAGERLEENIEGVLGQNLQHPPDLEIAVQPLRPDLNLDNLAETFLASQQRDREPVAA